MAASSASSYIRLAKTLPPRLQVFLARYPPAAILPTATAETQAPPAPTTYQQATPNPFKPTKHPVTGLWQNPVYSLRRQAELVKLARDHGVEELLPDGPKGTDVRLRKRVELGLRVKGTGVGQKVKGHIFERNLVDKMEKRRKAMRDMPKLIAEWKRVSKIRLGQDLRQNTDHSQHHRPDGGTGPSSRNKRLVGDEWATAAISGVYILYQHKISKPLLHQLLRTIIIDNEQQDKKMYVSGVTHYEVLGISREILDEAKEAQRPQIIKRAYHRALLRHHPDKAAAAAATATPSKPTTAGVAQTGQPAAGSTIFTIDQISTASAVLSDWARRKEYDAALSLSRAGRHADATGRQQPSDFQTGIETVDLDDLDADEERGLWSRGCRCGNERGFELSEDDLEAVADEGELIVGCQDCSLWLRVHFSVLHED
ncbi:hypothetical protein PpBr36_01105 [Pyricularia pennisetigena]|uniref:hypothetical protein n=1 Tax=Pyricularia pennisetigena TaxID=1578925 RepID=UPI00114DCB49|nr:hypothetical protein PpBr36_01105 [Pyricularia pennisetigena]TLS28402.1 hypothetical protein PpBr36_01105 [Pyricularia pennisetigena]